MPVKRKPKPNLSFPPITTTTVVHALKQRQGAVIETICGTILDTKHCPTGVRTTIWNDYTCGDCLRHRPLASRVPARASRIA